MISCAVCSMFTASALMAKQPDIHHHTAKFAPVATHTSTQTQDSVVLTSPRTGITYTLSNPTHAKIVFKTEEIAPATAQNATRIKAVNPALSTVSQDTAVQTLIQGIR